MDGIVGVIIGVVLVTALTMAWAVAEENVAFGRPWYKFWG